MNFMLSLFFLIIIIFLSLYVSHIAFDNDFRVTLLTFILMLLISNYLLILEDYYYVIAILMLILLIYTFLNKKNDE